MRKINTYIQMRHKHWPDHSYADVAACPPLEGHDPHCEREEPGHWVVDSTWLKIYDEGDWKPHRQARSTFRGTPY